MSQHRLYTKPGTAGRSPMAFTDINLSEAAVLRPWRFVVSHPGKYGRTGLGSERKSVVEGCACQRSGRETQAFLLPTNRSQIFI
jgi:hypothetical protein